MKRRIWFNRTFSTSYHSIEMIRNNPDGIEFEIFATHPKSYSVVLQAADYAEVEPSLDGYQYFEYCLEFCKKHSIDIFIPTFRLVEISKFVTEFESIGTQVLVSRDRDMLETISDKGKLFALLRNTEGVNIPEHFIVDNPASFQDAYSLLKERGHRVCFKPANGEGGVGFRVIDESITPEDKLFGPAAHKLSMREVSEYLSKINAFDDVMIMEFLDGYEYSIDCLAYNGTLLASIPRKKLEGRIRVIENNQELIRLAQVIHEKIQLPFLFNIQVRYKNDVPKLLEINPRASGGIHASCLSGVNFPYLAIKLLMDGHVEVPEPAFDIYASHIETDVIMTRIV